MDYCRTPEINFEPTRLTTITGLSPEITRLPGGTEYSYSGHELSYKRKALPGSWHGAKIAFPNNLVFTILTKLSPKHKPMDAISLFVANNGEIRWVKSDGVTNINNPKNPEKNFSDQLADWLSQETMNDSLFEFDNLGRRIKLAVSDLNRFGKLGYATFECGRLAPNLNNSWTLRVDFVGSTRKKKGDLIVGGDLGSLEAYSTEDSPKQYHGLYPDITEKNYVGQPEIKIHSFSWTIPSKQGFCVTTATDGCESCRPNGCWQNPGMVIERSIDKSKNPLLMLKYLETQGYINPIDDVSFLSIHLP